MERELIDKPDVAITRYNTVSFAAMVAFIASLNGNDEDHSGYFDTSVDDIASSLRALSLPIDESFRLAIHDGQIVGVLGIEADPEIGRAWIYGPLVRRPLWQAVADQPYAAALPAIPPGISQQQIFCDGRNHSGRDFAARHGLELLNASAS
jgi:hypothetical protein